MKTLEQYAEEAEQKINDVSKIINQNEGKSMKWRKSDNSYYVLSPSAKVDQNVQLTFFINNNAISDKVRSSFQDNDILEEIALSECELELVI